MPVGMRPLVQRKSQSREGKLRQSGRAARTEQEGGEREPDARVERLPRDVRSSGSQGRVKALCSRDSLDRKTADSRPVSSKGATGPSGESGLRFKRTKGLRGSGGFMPPR